MNIDDEWEYFMENDSLKISNDCNNNDICKIDNIPEATDIYISTKTKIVYLTIKSINIYDIFWKISIINYNGQIEGFIKKQIKVSLATENESKELDLKIEKINKYKKVMVINKLDNINNRSKYKDIRKISIGLSKKDLLISRSKEKSAFYNCFVVSLRLIENNLFKEYHIKIFNTGKIEIPGIQNEDSLHKIINFIINELSNILNIKINYNDSNIENVLVNSNFDCGFYINREILFNILRKKYSINAAFDPCSYPGIQCGYYYNKNTGEHIKHKDNNNLDNIKVSYMIFRTGSILIVGKCDDYVLNNVYEYIKEILKNEYYEIVTQKSNEIQKKPKSLNIKSKNKKRTILIK
tara:strand:+ start:2902 stop:3957 length:1056 start_codon:yes stop_codon:yes gene_type:complete